MPILVQWKWVEQPPSFLVIFHFYDDYSKPNLRTARMRFVGDRPSYIYLPEELVPIQHKSSESQKTRTVVTWAPSHSELGLLMDLLSYANIMNGFKEQVKRELRKELAIFEFDIDSERDKELFTDRLVDFRETLVGKVHAYFAHEDNKTGKLIWDFYAELCPEYIDYLKEILKPYL